MVASLAVSFAKLFSPPPETIAVFAADREPPATFTVSVIAGYCKPGPRISLRLQGPAGCAQVQPLPLIDVAISPDEIPLATVTAPMVGKVPMLPATIENVAP